MDTPTLCRCNIHEYDVTIGTNVSEEPAISISEQSKFLDHKGNWESALNNRIANLISIMCSAVQRTALPVNIRHFTHLHSRVGCCFTEVWGAGEEEEKERKGLLCQHLEVKMRFKILECTTCYSPPHDLKGQAAVSAGLQTWTYYLHSLRSNKTEPLHWKPKVLWNHTNKGPPSEQHKNNRWCCQITLTVHPRFGQNYIYEQIKIRLDSESAC
jgi:hypothetical protein